MEEIYLSQCYDEIFIFQCGFLRSFFQFEKLADMFMCPVQYQFPKKDKKKISFLIGTHALSLCLFVDSDLT